MKRKTKPRLIIAFLGPQGAGKVTQAVALAKRLGLPEISTGALYRREIDSDTRLGRAVKKDVSHGRLVADKITNSLLAKRLKEKDLKRGVVIDVYPRTLGQAAALQAISPPAAVYVIDVSDKTAIVRITGRRVCTACGASFHLKFHPPKKAGVCDVCGRPLIKRKDDTAESIKKRLRVYHRDTEPILAIYNRSKKLIRIDGNGPISDIAKQVWTRLPKWLKN